MNKNILKVLSKTLIRRLNSEKWILISDIIYNVDVFRDNYSFMKAQLHPADFRVWEMAGYEIRRFISDIYTEHNGWHIRKLNKVGWEGFQIRKNIDGVEHSYFFNLYIQEILPIVRIGFKGSFEYSFVTDISSLLDFGKFVIMNMDKLGPCYKKYGVLQCTWISDV